MKKCRWPATLPQSGSHAAFATEPAFIVTAACIARTADETLCSVTAITRKEIERRLAQAVRYLLRGT
ncbi:MAG: hypothetical protein ACOY4D_02045 [Pseudomonadota bacterium]|jgi:vitamin B12 transporter